MDKEMKQLIDAMAENLRQKHGTDAFYIVKEMLLYLCDVDGVVQIVPRGGGTVPLFLVDTPGYRAEIAAALEQEAADAD